MRSTLRAFIEALFKVVFSYDCLDEHLLPKEGPAIVAANHPSYLDPVLLSLQVERPIRFMAWDALFRVPILGSLIRAFGAFPVDIRRGKGRLAYERAKALVEAGHVVGLFPEGKRSRTGWMEPSLREGAARLAFETGAPLVPATIAGAYRAWPSSRSLPSPARIRVRFHEPIDPVPYRAMGKDEGIAELLAELRRRVDRSLLPGVKADLRMNVVYRLPAPWPRNYEFLPPMALALLVFWKTRAMLPVLPAYGYIAYLLLDHFFIPQRRFVKRLRNVSPVVFVLLYGRVVLKTLGLPDVPAQGALAAVLAGALFPYLYERGRTAIEFIRGLLVVSLFELGALYLAPVPLGPHVALPLFAAAYAWTKRTVFSFYTAPLLAAYVVGVAFLLRGGFPLVVHLITALVASLVVNLFPYRLRPEAEAEEEKIDGGGLGLNLRE
ncbi:MAG: lysophospholipid acyltransferase family protein [Vicinamibacteria bacterium]